MNIKYDFDFININKISGFQLGDGFVEKHDLDDFFSAINSVISWSSNSIYKNCFKGLEIRLTDCPGDNIFAHVDADPFTKVIFIEMNVLDMIYSYKDSVINKIIFKKDDVTLFQYICFFLLHELGHIVHCQMVIQGFMNLYDKMEEYSYKYLPFHLSLENKYDFYLSDETEIQKEYRRIPSEKAADGFAFSYFKKIKRLN